MNRDEQNAPDRDKSEEQMPEYERTQRSSTFTKSIEMEQDIEALGDRIAQPIGIGFRRGELDGVTVGIQERTAGQEDGFHSQFRSTIKSQNDVESVVQRILNTVAMAFNRGEIGDVKVTIIEARRVGDAER